VAQTKKKRRRKHSGTQAGTVQRWAASDKRPETKAERREAARRRREERLDRKPTLRGSLPRAAIAALIFVAFAILVLGVPPLQGLVLGVVMIAFYVPIGYFMDLFIYRRRQRKKGPPTGAQGGGGHRGRPRGER
jgi:Flp pilus assembly protein TadB